jgi:two-component system phosphate regulon sensor histidine kinase PhoR
MKIDLRFLFISFLIAVLVSAGLYFMVHLTVFPDYEIFFFLLFAIIIMTISFVVLKVLFYNKYQSILAKLSDQLPEKLNRSSLEKNDTLETIEKQIEVIIEERKKEIEHLKKLETYRKEYIGNVSHELKTPIFNIQGYIQTLLDGGLEDSAVNRKFLERADKSVERMITIVEDLQTITQFETGELVLDIENFDILALAKDVCDAMDMRAKTKNILLTVREMDTISYQVSGDRFRIRQVLANLVVNSIKYGKDRGETKIQLRDNGDFIMIEVSDNGIGIEKHHLPRLFERFYRVDKSRSRDQGGSGLGLAIVKHIIEAHDQHINVLSTSGVGSVFSFNLPKARISSPQ